MKIPLNKKRLPNGVQTRGLKTSMLAVSLVMHLLGLALPLALLQIYDRILPAKAYGTAIFLVAGVAVAILLEAILRYGRQAMFVSIGARYEAQATMAAFERLQHADINQVEQRGSAAISDALRAISHVRDFWSGQAGVALYELPFVGLYIALIAYVGGWLALIPLILFCFAILFLLLWNPRIQRAAKDNEHHAQHRSEFAWALFGGLDYIKAIGAEASMINLWRRINMRYMAHSVELESRMGWVRENASAIGQLSTALIVAFGAGAVIAGELTTGALAACTMLAGRSIGPAMASLGYWSQLARISEAQAQVDDLIQLPDAPTHVIERQSGAPKISRGHIKIAAPALFSEPVEINPGDVVHLHTTETPLASRLLTAIAGLAQDPGIRVTLDGHDLTEYNHADYRDAVVLVSRQMALISGSILNNLTLYDPRHNSKVHQFSEALGLQSHMDKLRHGVLTEVGPGTAEHLDEGIYQRIAIIRALVQEPRILLLDHAASGIDIDGVKRLSALLKNMQGKTTVLISTYKEPLIEACNRSLHLGLPGVSA